MQPSVGNEMHSEEGDFEDQAKRFMLVRIHNEYFCLNVIQLISVSYPQKIQRIPLAKKHIMGVVSLRGELSVQVDLAKKYSIADKQDSQVDCLVYVQTSNGRMAVPVQEVVGVKTVNASDILHEYPKPAGVPEKFINGAVRIDGQLFLVLDLAESLDESDLCSISDAMHASVS